MKRFYQAVTVSAAPYQILLDGKPVKTPEKRALALPTLALAEAVADEWRGQGDKIDPAAMPLTKLANTAIDRVGPAAAAVAAAVTGTLNDLLCYRAAYPDSLSAQQAAEWDPLLDWAAMRYGVRLKTGIGPIHIAQPEAAVAALGRAVASYDPFGLTALATAAGILGSLVLALALAEGRLTAAEAFTLSQLDERYQAERWGVDDEAAARAGALLAELALAERFLKLSSPASAA